MVIRQSILFPCSAVTDPVELDFRSQALLLKGNELADFRSQALLLRGNELADFRSPGMQQINIDSDMQRINIDSEENVKC